MKAGQIKEYSELERSEPKDRPRVFASYCKRILNALRGDEIGEAEAARLIMDGSLEGVAEAAETAYVLELACTLDSDFLGEENRKRAWETIGRFTGNFLEGRREPVHKELVAYYDEFEGERIRRSYGIRIKAISEGLEIGADNGLKKEIEKALIGMPKHVAEAAALEWSSTHLPKKIGTCRLRSARLYELLDSPPPPFSELLG